MEKRAFDESLDRFGGDLGRWPVELAADAAALLAVSPEAQRAKAGMDELESWLRAGARRSVPTAQAADRVSNMAATAMRHRQLGPARPVRRAAWSAAAAAALVLGVLVGNVAASIDTHDDSPDQLVAGALDATGTVDVE